jgi:hypothetical protein
MLLAGLLSAQFNAPVAGGSYDLLATEILTSSQASVTFSSLGDYASAGYQHLQLRITTRNSVASTDVDGVGLRFNGDTASNYNWHQLVGSGSSVSSFYQATNHIRAGLAIRDGNTANVFGTSVIDLLDPFSSSKYTTARVLSGLTGAGTYIGLYSGLWRNTASLTSVNLYPTDGSWVTGCRFSLYGLKASA